MTEPLSPTGAVETYHPVFFTIKTAARKTTIRLDRCAWRKGEGGYIGYVPRFHVLACRVSSAGADVHRQSAEKVLKVSKFFLVPMATALVKVCCTTERWPP
uniref:Uncharacterized protein n=1 Tax=Eutreptiella gymnastica TaxID=73025 RepID=A0A7S4GEW7_9EUGL